MIVIVVPKGEIAEVVQENFGSKEDLAEWIKEAAEQVLNEATCGEAYVWELDPLRNEYVPQSGEAAYQVGVSNEDIEGILQGIRSHEDYQPSWEEGIARALPRLQQIGEEYVWGCV